MTDGTSLSGKVALITGASRGIGAGVARRFASAGMRVAIGYQASRDAAASLAAEITQAGGECITVQGDVADGDAAQRVAAETAARFGRIDVLVNNAGIQHVAPLEQFPVEKWDAILAINLSSAFHTTRATLPSMRRNKFGRIINIASAHGLVASPFKSAYVAAKHGIVGLTKVTALETAEANHCG